MYSQDLQLMTQRKYRKVITHDREVQNTKKYPQVEELASLSSVVTTVNVEQRQMI